MWALFEACSVRYKRALCARPYRRHLAVVLAFVCNGTAASCMGSKDVDINSTAAACGRTGEIVLTANSVLGERTNADERRRFPTALAALDDTTFVVGHLDTLATVGLLASANHVELRAGVRFGLSPAAGYVLVYQDRMLYRYEPKGTLVPVAELPMGESFLAIAASRTMLLVESTSNAGIELRLYEAASGVTPQPTNLAAELSSPVRMTWTSLGTIAAAMARDPFTVLLFDQQLNRRGEVTLPVELLAILRSPAVEAVVQSVLDVDCDRVLVAITDLRSERRWLVTIDVRNAVTTGWRELEKPLGIVQRLPGVDVLAIVDPMEKPPGIVLYTWTWK